MIESWFNERGYKIVAQKGESRFVYDLPVSTIENAVSLYTSRWVVLNEMMERINELSEAEDDRDLTLHTDSRLIEELQGELTPDTSFAKSSLQYFIENDYVTFRRVDFKKCASNTINQKLSEAISCHNN